MPLAGAYIVTTIGRTILRAYFHPAEFNDWDDSIYPAQYPAHFTNTYPECRIDVVAEHQANTIVYALIRNFGGERLYIPHHDYQERNQEMISLHQAGASIDQLASRYRLAIKTVYRIIMRDKKC